MAHGVVYRIVSYRSLYVPLNSSFNTITGTSTRSSHPYIMIDTISISFAEKSLKVRRKIKKTLIANARTITYLIQKSPI